MKKIVLAVVLGLVLAAAVLWIGLAGRPEGDGDGGSSSSATSESRSGSAVEAESGETAILGVWAASVYNLDFPSRPDLSADELKSELDTIIENTKSWGLNALFLQVRPCADSLCKSDIFPVSSVLSSTGALPDGFDPLAYAVERAHAAGIELHAWINPLRVTAGNAEQPQHDPASLPEGSPARAHPEYTVPYADGKLYFDAGYPEVRQLVVDGVVEIIENYDVDGIHFDDYFYPYPVAGASFDDAESYAQYGDGRSLEDFRRDNITSLIRAVHDAVEAAAPDVAFGVSPFAVWRSDENSELGSPTRAGVETYSDLYADTRLWVKENLLDYIAPQIYWSMEQPGVEFPVVYDWWKDVVQGTDVKLVAGHAAYKVGLDEYGWDEPGELADQVAYAMNSGSFGGSVFYRYATLTEDPDGIVRQLGALFQSGVAAPESESVPQSDQPESQPPEQGAAPAEEYGAPPLISAEDGPKVLFSSSNGGYTTSASSGSIIGGANPSLPLYLGEEAVSMTEKGFFSLYLDLDIGENTFVFTQGDEEFPYTITRTQVSDGGENADPYQPWPGSDCWYSAGQSVELSVNAPAGASVTAVHRTAEFTLEPVDTDGDWWTYACEAVLYGGGKDAVSYRIESEEGTETVTSAGALSIYDTTRRVFLKVTEPDSVIRHTRIVYARFDVPVLTGTMLEAVGFEDGYYVLKDFGFIAEGRVELVNETLEDSFIRTARLEEDDTELRLKIYKTGARAVDVRAYPNSVCITAYGRSLSVFPALALGSQEEDVTVRRYADRVEYLIQFQGDRAFTGYALESDEDGVTVVFSRPRRASEQAQPLAGMKVALNAGHGRRSGAPGPLGADGWVEDDFNQDIVNRTRDYLTALGASVTTISDYDAPKEIEEVVQEYQADRYDVAVSVHFNSVAESADPSRACGTCAYYAYPNAQRLAKVLTDSVCAAAEMENNGVIRDSFYVTRTYACPSVLMEMGYMCNPAEYDRLCEAETRDRLAKGLADGILQYLQG